MAGRFISEEEKLICKLIRGALSDVVRVLGTTDTAVAKNKASYSLYPLRCYLTQIPGDLHHARHYH